MAISPLDHQGDITVEQFEQLFGTQIGEDFPNLLVAFKHFGPMHSYRVSNLLHLSLQKGNTDKIVNLILEWYEIVLTAPDDITAHTDTHILLESMYTEFLDGMLDLGDGSKVRFVPTVRPAPNPQPFRPKMWVVRSSQN